MWGVLDLVYVLLAYLLCGWATVSKDLSADPINAPGWTYKPTFKMFAFVFLTWFFRPYFESIPFDPRGKQKIISGLIGSTLQLAIATFMIWFCWWLASRVTDYFLVHAVLFVVLWIVIGFFSGIIFLIPMMLVSFLVVSPLAYLFGFFSKTPDPAKDVAWCRNCQHYKKSEEFENTMKGLWQSETMPRSDKLPCAITIETAEVWKAYFSGDPKKRFLFPKGCPQFMKKI